MYDADIGVIQRGQNSGLTLETRPRAGVTREFGGHALDGHRARQPRVTRAIDNAHSPSADHLLNLERADFLTDEIVLGRTIDKSLRLGLNKRIEQRIDLSQSPDTSSDTGLVLGISLDEFFCVRLFAPLTRMNELRQCLIEAIRALVAFPCSHPSLSYAAASATRARDSNIPTAPVLLSNLAAISSWESLSILLKTMTSRYSGLR